MKNFYIISYFKYKKKRDEFISFKWEDLKYDIGALSKRYVNNV